MMGKRFLLSATLAVVLASAGCTRHWCENHGYYPTPPAGYSPQCCVPVCQPGAGYVAPVSGWSNPAVPAPACNPGCVPAR